MPLAFAPRSHWFAYLQRDEAAGALFSYLKFNINFHDKHHLFVKNRRTY